MCKKKKEITNVIYSLSFPNRRKLYIGAAWNFHNRIAVHKTLLKKQRHHSIHLQRAANKYGLKNIIIKIIEKTSRKNLENREQYWIDKNKKRLYNISLKANPISNSRLGAKMPESAKQAISRSLIGNKYRKGIPHDNETKLRISESLKRAYKEGRRIVSIHPENLAKFNKAVKSGKIPHPRKIK